MLGSFFFAAAWLKFCSYKLFDYICSVICIIVYIDENIKNRE